MKARLGHIYFTFKDSHCINVTTSRGYVKGKYAALAMVALRAAGAGVAQLVTVRKPLRGLCCQTGLTGIGLVFILQEGKVNRTQINQSKSETVKRHGR